MEFFTTQDVLDWGATAPLKDPITIGVDSSIKTALETMFENRFSQLPVDDNGHISGAISYRSISRALKSFENENITKQAVGVAMEHPKFVGRDQDIYELFETLARDDYVLIGEPKNLEGIMTRYDVFFFLEEQVRPFLLIGDSERALRQLFESAFDDIEHQIDQTFSARGSHNGSYSPPESLDDFSYWEYQTFISVNWGTLGEYFSADKGAVVNMIEELGSIRNALFHFREGAADIDRDLVEQAHQRILRARERGL